MKRILLFGPPFFNYIKQIQAEMERLGFTVDYFNDRPSDISLEKALLRTVPRLMQKRVNHYLESILTETKHRVYDVIIIINGRSLNPEFVTKLRDTHAQSSVTLYLWDSITLYPNVLSLIPLVDRAYSFDLKDCEDYPGLQHLPLFYKRDYADIPNRTAEPRYDLISVCTAHPNRFAFMKKHFPIWERDGLSIFSWIYINRYQYYYYKFGRKYSHSHREDFHFTPLRNEEYLKKLSESVCVFDVNHSAQTGLTMRTMETLGAKRKLITTNPSILRYDFYRINNVLVIDPDQVIPTQVIRDFLELEYEALPDDIYEKYSIQNFTKELIGKHYDKV